jgi:hypothetical protein
MARQKASRNPESLSTECQTKALIATYEKKKVSLKKEFCEACYHNKEAHTFGNCAYCNCKGFIEKKKVSL